jgi:hypothetical protein
MTLRNAVANPPSRVGWAGCRGAINGLMAEIMEGEVRFHILSPKARPHSNRAKAADQLVQVIETYLK